MNHSEFTRDSQLEKRAFDAGWSLEKIQRCRLADLRNIFDKPQNKKKNIITAKPLLHQHSVSKDVTDLKPLRQDSGHPTVFNVKVPFSTKVDKNDKSPHQIRYSPTKDKLNTSDTNNTEEEYGSKDLEEILIQKRLLENKLDILNRHESFQKKNIQSSNRGYTQSFDLHHIWKMKDAPKHIHNFFISITNEYAKIRSNFERKTELILEIENDFDEDEVALLRKSTLGDLGSLKKLEEKLKSIFVELGHMITKKNNVLDLLENSYDEKGEIILIMKGKLQKYKSIHAVMDDKLSTWNHLNASQAFN